MSVRVLGKPGLKLRWFFQLCSGSRVEVGDRVKLTELVKQDVKWPGLTKWGQRGDVI